MLKDFFSLKASKTTEAPYRSVLAYVFEQVLTHSWWVVLFLILCYATYEQASKHYKIEYEQLSQQLSKLVEEKEIALHTRQDLLLQINSQNDPAWVELTLMKVLGVVPEGQTKVFFLHEKKSLTNLNSNMIP